MKPAPWSGRRVQRARAMVATWLPAPCGRCGKAVHPDDDWVVGHIKSRAAYPELTWVVANWQPEHDACSRPTAQAAVIEKARLEGARFPHLTTPTEPPDLPVSPPGARRGRIATVEPRDGLAWSAAAMRRHAWTAEFAQVPPDASPPLWMSPVPADAVGSYGPDAIEWIELIEGKVLRWWQRLAIVRQLEHRADGTLCHRVIVESAPRRSGKSVRLRGLAMWRMVEGTMLFGEQQLVMHTGSDIAICREVQRAAWRWAEAEWGDKAVTRANGKEAVETSGGDRWLVRSQDGVYGYDVTLGLVDEGWRVKPDTVSEGLEPATMERSSPQLHLTSTAHRRATSLMRGRLSTALAVDDGETLLLVWAAPAGADISDPDVWRSASPHWTADRQQMIRKKYLAALAGEVDPEADDPDPMAGFTAQYLNIWRLSQRAAAAGEALLDEDVWLARQALPDLDRAPDGAAIESWSADGVSLALAWREGDGAIVTASDHRDLADAVRALRASRFRGRVVAGASLVEDPAMRGVPATSTKARTAAAAVELGRLVAEGQLHHDGGEYLTDQVLDVRTQPGADGPRLVSKGRADAVKAAAWAAGSARSSRRLGIGIVTA